VPAPISDTDIPCHRLCGFMFDTILACLISIGMIGGGIGWIVADITSIICIGIGVASIGVGVSSLSNELLNRAR
jgi:hypothetical protein